MEYMDDRLGFVSDSDQAYTMDNYGYLVSVPFTIGYWYFQEH
jgi:hypothetical protein